MKPFSSALRMWPRAASVALIAMGFLACDNDSPLPGPEVGMLVTPHNFDLVAGDSRTLTAIVLPGGNVEVEWTSSAPGIAAVTSGGVVTGVSAGLATVRATQVRDRSQVASTSVRVLQRAYPIAGTYDLTFAFDSTRFEVTAPNGGCPTSVGYCTYTRPTGAKSALSGSMRILDSTFTFTPTFPSGPPRQVSIAEVTLTGRFCTMPDLATPVGCAAFEDIPASRHTGWISRVPSIPPTESFVRIDSGTVSGDFPTERFLSLTYTVTADSLYGRFQWILRRSVRSPTAQLGSFVARRRQ